MVAEGDNRGVDPGDSSAILGAVDEVLAAPMPAGGRPELWDGHAAARIVDVIAAWAAPRDGRRASRAEGPDTRPHAVV